MGWNLAGIFHRESRGDDNNNAEKKCFRYQLTVYRRTRASDNLETEVSVHYSIASF